MRITRHSDPSQFLLVCFFLLYVRSHSLTIALFYLSSVTTGMASILAHWRTTPLRPVPIRSSTPQTSPFQLACVRFMPSSKEKQAPCPSSTFMRFDTPRVSQWRLCFGCTRPKTWISVGILVPTDPWRSPGYCVMAWGLHRMHGVTRIHANGPVSGAWQRVNTDSQLKHQHVSVGEKNTDLSRSVMGKKNK